MLPGEVRSSITEGDRPKGGDLEALEARANTLRAFPPATLDQRKTMIARLFLRFGPNAGGRATEEEVMAYAQDLAPFPLWAIVAGIADIIAGHVLKAPEYRPSSLTVRAAVEARMSPVRDELAQLDTVLGAKVVADDAVVPSLERRKELAGRARDMMRAAAPAAFPERKPHPRLSSSFDKSRGYVSTPIDLSKLP